MSEPAGTAIVTGASSGIGAALAPRLAASGYDLVLVARRTDRLEALADGVRRDHGRAVKVLALDVTAPGALEAVRAAAPEPAVLVNNAGVGQFGAAATRPVDEQVHMVRLNCEALTALTLGLLPAMVARGRGVVLNMASIAGLQPVPFYAVYGATKAYVVSLSEALDEELRGTGVRVVAVCPGPVPTEFQEKSGSPDARLTAGRALMTAEQIAEQCVDAIARPRRLVVPAATHRAMFWVQRFLPRSTVVSYVASRMRKRLSP